MDDLAAALAQARAEVTTELLREVCVIRRPTALTADDLASQAIVETTVCMVSRPGFGMGDAALDAAALIPSSDELSIHLPYGTNVLAGDNLVIGGHVYAVRRILDDLSYAFDMTALATRKS